MSRFVVSLIVSLIILFGVVSDAPSQRGGPRGQTSILATGDGKPSQSILESFAAVIDTVLLAEYTFDDGFGGPDAQGWTSVDMTAQPGTFFHVDDFSGLSGWYTP